MRLIVIVGLLLTSFVANGQRFAVASGNWNDPIWATTFNGVAGSAATPTAADNVFTNGFSVTIDSDVSCLNLNVRFNVSQGIVISDFSFATLTINGTLSGVTATPSPTQVTIADALIMGEFERINFVGAGQKINAWGYTCPLGNVDFNPGAGQTATISQGFRVSNNATLAILSGTLSINTASNGRQLRGCSTCSLQIANGAQINTFSAINGGGTTSSDEPNTLFGSIDVSGTLTTSSYVNSENFIMSSTGILNTTYNGVNQSQGWWHTTNSPTGVNLNTTSTVNYSFAGSQNVAPLDYGNLTLSGSGTINKILSGSGTLNVNGTLNISTAGITFNTTAASAISIGGNVSNAGTWTPTDLVSFNGTNGQSIGGTSTITFSGGLDINKSAGTLTLNRAINIANGLTISQGTLNLGSQTVTLTSGNIDNDGTFTVGSSTFIVNGTTSITGSSPVSFNNLTIGASGNLSASGTINIAGNLSNSGILNATTTAFNGSVAQNITGTGTLTNINVTNTAGVSNNGTINLTGTLTLSGGGVFDTDGSGSGIFNIISDDLTSNAGIATLTTPSNLSGNVNVQRFINGPDDYRYLAVPVSGATVSLWQDDFPVTGNFSNPSPNGVNGVVSSTAPSIFRFDAPTQAYVAIGTGASTAATSLSSTVGYSAYTYLTGDFVIDMAGQPTKGNVNVPLSTAGAGWNLVPNPYPSPIDWDNVSRTGTSGSMYLTTAQGSFATYLAGSGTCTGCSFNSGWRGEVAIGQSFWIESTGSTTLALTETAKTTSSATYVREADESIDMFRITLKSQGKEDDLIIRFDNEATFATELTLDSKKRLNDYYLNISSYNTNPAEHYAINGIPLAICGASNVKLKMSNLSGTSHSLAFTELDKLTLGYMVTLKDNFTGTERTIVNGDEYSFQTTTDPASKADGRFELKFTSPAIQAVASSAIAVESTCESNLLNINISNAQSGVTYQLFKGETPVSNVINGTGSDLNTIVLKSSLSAGLNVLNLKASTLDGCQTTTFDNIVSYELVNVPQVLSVTGASVCNTGNATLTAQGSSEAVAYRWYDSQLNDATYVQTVGNALTLEGVNESKSYYVTTLNKNGCESLTRTEVSVQVTTINTPEVSLNGTTLLSSSATGNQWYKNGVIIPGATSSSYEVTETGIYTVAVTVNTCSLVSDEITVAITGLEFKGEQSVALYPNPVNDWLTIELAEDIVTQVKSLKLIDTKGVLISAYNPEEIINGTLSINMVDQAKAIYLLAITTADRTLIYRIIKN
jgi:hypothetical protein